jgi:putative tricarboxylic transport membrane protein
MTIRAPKDFWSGIMFMSFAAVALVAARNYSLGSAGHMGTGYFPVLLSVVLTLIGVILIGRSFVINGERVGTLGLLPLAVIAAAVCVFGLAIETLGLVVALILVTLIAAAASRQSRPLQVGLLAVLLAAFSAGIFAYALRLPLPVWPPFLG